jgi:two-component system OmpR family response regulator
VGSVISRARGGGAGRRWRKGGEERWRKNENGAGKAFRAAKSLPRTVFLHNPAMARRIALIEDDPTIRQNYVDALTRAGYEVNAFGDRKSASKTLAARLPELAIIDIGLGDDVDGGFELCRELRAASARLPIIFLSARDSDFDIVSGLRLGADDYLTKDVSLPHLLARIAALFRRVDATSSPAVADDVLNRGRLALDAQRMMASWEGKPIALTVTEFWMVHSLARHPGHVKDRDQLMRDAEMVVDDGTITSHVKRIRRKFLAVDEKFDAIETVYGMGYRWTEPS